jgi:hypothetical protein
MRYVNFQSSGEYFSGVPRFPCSIFRKYISKNLITNISDDIEIHPVGARGLDNKAAELTSPVPVSSVPFLFLSVLY